ncbi:MAG: CoA-binding protein [DPANN group archaeon]|nr:CoA-binding protein [DPANN group archaeon]
MDSFFKPESVAIIGASEDKKKLGNAILTNFINGFKGKIYPINPKQDMLMGLKAYASVKDVKGKIDLAIIVVPAVIANKAVKDCVDKKIPSVVMITAGYRETNSNGVILENQLKLIIKNSKTRIIGPNCIGVMDTAHGVNTLFTPAYKMKKPKNGFISILSQSGAVGTTLIDIAGNKNLGVSKFISYGNRIDLDESDIINYFAKDKETKIILAYIEGVKDGRKFLDALKNISKNKPIIILKAGKSDMGAKAAASHTGSLAGSYEIFKSVLKQGGAIESKDMEDMFDYVNILSENKKPKGKRIGIVTNGGGFGVMCTDAALANDLEIAEFDKATINCIKNVMPEYATIHNPVDLIGDADIRRFKTTIDAVTNDKNVDIVAIYLWTLGTTLDFSITDIISEVSKKTKKPIIVGASGSKYTKGLSTTIKNENIPVYTTPTRLMDAVKILVNRTLN